MTIISSQTIIPGRLATSFSSNLTKARKNQLIQRILSKDPSAFHIKDPAHIEVILNRLGWIDAVRDIPEQIAAIELMVEEVRASGVQHLFVLGMGGSSLCPEVFGAVFKPQSWLKSYTIVDTTAPSRIGDILDATDLSKAFFIVSSKSGSTIETSSQFQFFFDRVKKINPRNPGMSFAAITDLGSDLEKIGKANKFRRIFINRADIGGRYSALSFFGLVPGGFTRMNLNAILKEAAQLLANAEMSSDTDPLDLGILIGCGAGGGFDKLHFMPSKKTAPLIPWIEQLVAESTGKKGKGVIPIEGAPVLTGKHMAKDSIYISISMKGEKPSVSLPMVEKHKPRLPLVKIVIPGPQALGAEMLKWEMATAVAATVMGVNPFDEPNVAESKKNTSKILQAGQSDLKPAPLAQFKGISIQSLTGLKKPLSSKANPRMMLHAFLAGVGREEYLSILSFTEMTPAIEKLIMRLRTAIEADYKITTLRGYGPRYLHSIGQLYKGGCLKGHFMVLEREFESDFEIAGGNLTFGRLIKAQAEGDIMALAGRKRPVARIQLGSNPLSGLKKLLELVEK
jgi:transaldolase / glucose-6-phosphate isomerase